MRYTKTWIHLVWAKKKRLPLLNKSIRQQVFDHIRENAKAKNSYIALVNGDIGPIHVLLSLSPEQTVAKVVQLIKGESSSGSIKTG